MTHKDTASLVDEFHVNGVIFTHKIFCSDDARIECRNEYGDLVLTFTANCAVLDAKGKQIGHWSMGRRNEWTYYHSSDSGEEVPHSFGIDLLKAEIEVSKMYLNGDLK